MTFSEKLHIAWQENRSILCVGIDPVLTQIPARFANVPKSLLAFSKYIVDETAQFSCAFKFQFAFFAAHGAEDELKEAIDYVKAHYPQHLVVLDAKRGDISHTNEAYVEESFERYKADVVTVNPYLGVDALTPFMSSQEKGAAVLCRTSNSESALFQTALIDDGEGGATPVYLWFAQQVIAKHNVHKNSMLVMGATNVSAIEQVRKLDCEIPLLVPGIGAQGGDLKQVLQAGLDTNGDGLLVCCSRRIIYSDNPKHSASELHQAINAIRLTSGDCK